MWGSVGYGGIVIGVGNWHGGIILRNLLCVRCEVGKVVGCFWGSSIWCRFKLNNYGEDTHLVSGDRTGYCIGDEWVSAYTE